MSQSHSGIINVLFLMPELKKMGQDEQIWAAVWLFVATGREDYKAFIAGDGNGGGVQSTLSWDKKFLGAQALVAKASEHLATLDL